MHLKSVGNRGAILVRGDRLMSCISLPSVVMSVVGRVRNEVVMKVLISIVGHVVSDATNSAMALHLVLVTWNLVKSIGSEQWIVALLIFPNLAIMLRLGWTGDV